MKFQKNIELDAFLIYTAMHYGPEGFLEAAFLKREDFPGGPDTAIARSDWLKKQSKEYIKAVSERVVEMEKVGR